MPEGNLDKVRSVYGIDWVAVGERQRGLAAAAELLAPDVQARISPEVGDRTLHGLEQFCDLHPGARGGLLAFPLRRRS